jgi:membrane protease YdiL (CAAX protease family)
MPSRFAAALAVLVLWLLATLLTGRPPPPGATALDIVTEGVARQLVVASAVVALAALLLRWPELGLGPPLWRRWSLLWLPALYLALFGSAVAVFGLPPGRISLLILANCLLVGFSEEMMFRGILWVGLRDRLGLWPAALLSSALFGAVHVFNVALTGQLAGAILQSIAATMSGLLYLALRLRLGSIWPVVLLHALWNAALFHVLWHMPPPPPDEPVPLLAQLPALLLVLPLGVYGVVLLRRHARAEAAPEDGGGRG